MAGPTGIAGIATCGSRQLTQPHAQSPLPAPSPTPTLPTVDIFQTPLNTFHALSKVLKGSHEIVDVQLELIERMLARRVGDESHQAG